MMSTAQQRDLTAAQYLAIERRADHRSEFFDGEMFAMAGGSPAHSLIAANFIREAGNALREKPCVVYGSDLRVKVIATGLYTYPDATVACDDQQFDGEENDTLVNPTVLVEVLSKSTEGYDRGTKSQHYRQIESLAELILIDQYRVGVERFARQTNGSWSLREQRSLTEHLPIEVLGVSVSLAEIYRDVKFVQARDVR